MSYITPHFYSVKPTPKTASDDLLPDSYGTLSKIVPPSAINEVVDLPKLQPTNVSLYTVYNRSNIYNANCVSNYYKTILNGCKGNKWELQCEG